MAFRIEISIPARDDIDDAIAYIAKDSPVAAARWKTGLQKLIFSLREMPSRFPVIPEVLTFRLKHRLVGKILA